MAEKKTNKQLTKNAYTVLCELYSAVDCNMNEFVEAKVHHNTLYALERRAYIELKKENGVRYVAITETGIFFVDAHGGINATSINSTRFRRPETRQRITIQLQIDLGRLEHVAAMERIQALKQERSFLPTVLKLLALDESLKNSDFDLLQIFYPECWHKMQSENFIVVEQLQLLMRKLDTMQFSTASRPMLSPVFDDNDEDLLTIEKDKDGGKRASANFLRSLGALTGVDFSSKVEEDTEPVETINVLSVPQFAAPVFHDDEDLLGAILEN